MGEQKMYQKMYAALLSRVEDVVSDLEDAPEESDTIQRAIEDLSQAMEEVESMYLEEEDE